MRLVLQAAALLLAVGIGGVLPAGGASPGGRVAGGFGLSILAPETPATETPILPDPGELRLGFSFGGISFVGLLLEQRWGARSVELNIGTWGFRDLAVSLVAKQYYGPGDFRPYSGLGFWAVAAAPPADAGEQQGLALLLRAPVGVEWNLDAAHHVGADLALNRALKIRRKDPRDQTPPSTRLVPFPGFHYRWKH